MFATGRNIKMASTILVIDDDVQTYLLIAAILRRKGYDVTHAQNTQVAFELIQEEVPQLILLDLRLPGMSGWKFARQLKQHTKYQAIPIVAISAKFSAEDKAQAALSGIEQHVPRPFNIRRLHAVVQEYIAP